MTAEPARGRGRPRLPRVRVYMFLGQVKKSVDSEQYKWRSGAVWDSAAHAPRKREPHEMPENSVDSWVELAAWAHRMRDHLANLAAFADEQAKETGSKIART